MMNYIGNDPVTKKYAAEVTDFFIENGEKLHAAHGDDGIEAIAGEANRLMYEKKFEKAIDMIDSNL